MRRWILKAGTTDLDGLVLEDAPMPEPGAGEVRIHIHAVSLNYRDQFILKGQFGSRLPDRDLVPVSDGAGEIDAIGAGVEKWAVGDRVTGLYFAWLGGIPEGDFGFGLGSLDEDGMRTGTLNQSLTALAYQGEVALIGLYQFDQGPLEFATLMSKSATVRGISVGNAEMYEAMVQAIDQYQIRPPINRRFRFEDAKDAYRAQSSSELFGKIVIDVV